MTGARPGRRIRLAAIAAVLPALLLAGCGTSSGDTIAGQATGKGFVSSDGAVEEIPAVKRGQPLNLAGTTLQGSAWSLRNQRGKVVVINVWGSWCPPCVEETPDLQRVWSRYRTSGAPVQFIGIDTRESPATGLAFLKAKGVTYPSLTDQGGKLQLALRGEAPATPTTLVLDKQHRIAARSLGKVDAGTLQGLIDDVLGNSSRRATR